MKKLFVYIVIGAVSLTSLIALSIHSPLPEQSIKVEKGNLAIKNVNIIDVIDGVVSTNKTVFIKNGYISDIVDTKLQANKGQYKEINAKGKFLIPGLWDMHTHGTKLSPQLHHPLFIRYGITSVRDMSGCLNQDDSYWACAKDRVQWEAEALEGKRVSPRYPLQSSYQTNGGNEVPDGFPEYFKVKSKKDAKMLAQFYRSRQVDFIKTYTELTTDQFDWLVEAAAQEGLSIAGHKPLSISLSKALSSKMNSIEHGRLFAFECYKEIEAFRSLPNPLKSYTPDLIRTIIDRQDNRKCQGLMEEMAASNTWWVPTLTTLKMSAMSRDKAFKKDPRLKYIPYIVKKIIWEQDIERAATKGNDANGKFVHADYYDLASSYLKQASQAGVKLMAGTDNIDTYVFTGSSLHDELGYLVEAGLTPLQALQAATIQPAKFSGLAGELGSIDINKKADLILLNSNPLIEIKNTQEIDGVIFDGGFFDKEALHKMEIYTAKMAKSFRVNLRSLSDLLLSPLMRQQLAD